MAGYITITQSGNIGDTQLGLGEWWGRVWVLLVYISLLYDLQVSGTNWPECGVWWFTRSVLWWSYIYHKYCSVNWQNHSWVFQSICLFHLKGKRYGYMQLVLFSTIVWTSNIYFLFSINFFHKLSLTVKLYKTKRKSIQIRIAAIFVYLKNVAIQAMCRPGNSFETFSEVEFIMFLRI